MRLGDADATFYFDLASPLAYLAAERALPRAGRHGEWQPVLARDLPGDDGAQQPPPEGGGDACATPWSCARPSSDCAAALAGAVPVRQRARERAATYAMQIGQASRSRWRRSGRPSRAGTR